MRNFQLFFKRLFDLVLSSLAMIILIPLFIIIAILIKFTSEGSVFFLQERIGLKGKVFKIIKFRTMVVNAEHIGDGIRVRTENDSRITKVGRILRATSLDELPQLINVITGERGIIETTKKNIGFSRVVAVNSIYDESLRSEHNGTELLAFLYADQ